jgi:hypothetical protein
MKTYYWFTIQTPTQTFNFPLDGLNRQEAESRLHWLLKTKAAKDWAIVSCEERIF